MAKKKEIKEEKINDKSL